MSRVRAASLAIAVLCVATAAYLQLAAQDAGRALDAERAARAGRFDEALDLARTVRRAPADLRARLTEARVLTAQGKGRRASDAYAAVARRDPNNWLVHWEWARQSAPLDLPAAIERLRRAKELNPLLPVQPGIERGN